MATELRIGNEINVVIPETPCRLDIIEIKRSPDVSTDKDGKPVYTLIITTREHVDPLAFVAQSSIIN